jgi:hypothetical protein
MRRLLLLVPLVAVLLPATAAAKGRPGETDEPTRVTWLTAPDGSKPGGPGWLARMSITGDVARSPEVVVRDERTGTIDRVVAVPDGAGVWAARVRFEHAGDFSVWAARYDPREPWRIHEIGPAVHVADPAAPAPDAGFPWWIPAAVLGVVAVAVGAPRLRAGLRAHPAG